MAKRSTGNDEHLASVGIHVGGYIRLLPTLSERQENCGNNLGGQFDELSAECWRCLIRNPQTSPPKKLSTTTVSASSRAAVPIQWRRAAGLMITNSGIKFLNYLSYIDDQQKLAIHVRALRNEAVVIVGD